MDRILRARLLNDCGVNKKRKKSAVYLAAAFASFFRIASLAIVYAIA
jgi:hypothetical protein